MVQAVLWDLGGVLLDWDPRHLYRKLFGADAAAMDHFLARICSPTWHEEQDLGKATAQACAELAVEHPAYADLINAWAERNEEMVSGAISGSVEVLAELRATGVACYALSNMEKESWQRRVGLYEFLGWFDDRYWYLLPRVAFNAVYLFYKTTVTVFPDTERGIRVKLLESKLLFPNKDRLTCRLRIGADSIARVLRVLRPGIEVDPSSFESGSSGTTGTAGTEEEEN